MADLRAKGFALKAQLLSHLLFESNVEAFDNYYLRIFI